MIRTNTLAESKKRRLVFLLLAAMMLVQLGLYTFAFGWLKNGYHNDEINSYWFANFVGYGAMESEERYPSGKWVSGEILRDALAANTGETFDFSAVYENQDEDLSPALHSYLLHFICSFFPDQFSYWFSYIINVLAFLIAIPMLFLLTKELTGSRTAALCTCLWYGFCTGGVNTFIFLRMYALLTAFALALCWLHARMYRKGFARITPELLGAAAVTCLGCLTHLYFILLAFCLALCTCLWLAFHKRWRSLIAYAAAELAGVVLFALFWPPIVQRIVGTLFPQTLEGASVGSLEVYSSDVVYDYALGTCLRYLIRDLTGANITRVVLTAIGLGLAFALVIALMFLFLIRNDERFLAAKERFRQRERKKGLAPLTWCALFLLISVAVSLAVIAYNCHPLLMGEFSDRYLMFLIPLICALAGTALSRLLRRRKPLVRRCISLVLAVALAVTSLCFGTKAYLFTADTDEDIPSITELAEDMNVLLIPNFDGRLIYFSGLIYNAKSFYMFVPDDITPDVSSLTPPEDDGPVLLLVNSWQFMEADENGEFTVTEEELSSLSLGKIRAYTVEQLVDNIYELDWVHSLQPLYLGYDFSGELWVFLINGES